MTKPSAPQEVWISRDGDVYESPSDCQSDKQYESLVRYIRSDLASPPNIHSSVRDALHQIAADSSIERTRQAVYVNADEARVILASLDAAPPRAAGADYILRELVACKDLADELEQERLYGKPHEQAHKNKELDYRQRKIEAWRAAREYLVQSRAPTRSDDGHEE